jgi:hypothetical protein
MALWEGARKLRVGLRRRKYVTGAITWKIYLVPVHFFLSFFFCRIEVLTQGSTLAKQALYHFSQASSSFLLWLLWR